MITNKNKLIQQEMTRFLTDYLSNGYQLRLGDSSQGYDARVDLEKPGEPHYVSITAETEFISSTLAETYHISPFTEKVVISVTRKVGTFDIIDVVSTKDYYCINLRGTAVTDSLNTYLECRDIQQERQNLRHMSDISAVNVPQDKLKKLVAGKSGFGKKTLKRDILTLIKKPGTYVIKSALTDSEVVKHFPTKHIYWDIERRRTLIKS